MFKELPNVLGIADDILIVGYDDGGADHDRNVCRVLQICRNENLKLNKDKSYFRCTSLPFFGKNTFQIGV